MQHLFASGIFQKMFTKPTLILYEPGREETGKDPRADPLPASRQLCGTLTAVREPLPYPLNGMHREFLLDSHSWLHCATFLNRDGKSNRTAKPR